MELLFKILSQYLAVELIFVVVDEAWRCVIGRVYWWNVHTRQPVTEDAVLDESENEGPR